MGQLKYTHLHFLDHKSEQLLQKPKKIFPLFTDSPSKLDNTLPLSSSPRSLKGSMPLDQAAIKPPNWPSINLCKAIAPAKSSEITHSFPGRGLCATIESEFNLTPLDPQPPRPSSRLEISTHQNGLDVPARGTGTVAPAWSALHAGRLQ